MFLKPLDQLAVLLACLLAFYWMIRKRRIPNGLRLPPGPPGKFILGNLLDLPTHHEWETVTHSPRSDVVHLEILNTHYIYVNSADAAYELLERRSSVYSDRLDLPMLNDLMGLNWVLSFMPYGEKWRRHRRAMNKRFHPTAVMEYHGIQTRQPRSFLQRPHESPSQVMKHIRHHSGAIIMEIIYGIHVLPENDPYIQNAEIVMEAIPEAGLPGAFLVDIFPILKHVPAWFPGAGFRRKAHNWKMFATKLVMVPFDVVKKGLIAGTAEPSFVASLLEEQSSKSDALKKDEDTICNTAAVAYLGGSDTTVGVLSFFVLVMVLYPETQRKAQEELDMVIGNRLPEFKDRESLPYVNSLCKEVLRWHPIAPLGLAHRVSQDDVYDGMFIPGGSIVLGNAWKLLRDEKVYGEEPERFRPERFLKSDTRDPTYSIGFGWRICPGQYIADNSVFIAVSSVLKAFDITHATDNNGNKIPVEDASTFGFMVTPEPFQCDIKLRPGLTKSLIFPEL